MLFPKAAIAAALVAKFEIIGKRTCEKTNQSKGFGSLGTTKVVPGAKSGEFGQFLTLDAIPLGYITRVLLLSASSDT